MMKTKIVLPNRNHNKIIKKQVDYGYKQKMSDKYLFYSSKYD